MERVYYTDYHGEEKSECKETADIELYYDCEDCPYNLSLSHNCNKYCPLEAEDWELFEEGV
jgi:hypothetical protein